MKTIKEPYWLNGEGYYDPTLANVIEKENDTEKANKKSRSKQIHDTIQEIKNLLEKRDLVLCKRIELEDKRTNKKYR